MRHRRRASPRHTLFCRSSRLISVRGVFFKGAAVRWSFRQIGFAGVAVSAAAMWAAPPAVADDGWVAVANSPNHEQQDWAYGPDQVTAESNVLAQCAVLQRADDCRVLAVSTDCVATAWDMSEPLNQIYAGSGGGPEAAARGAIAAAGPYANDLQVRCTWWPRDAPEPLAPSAPGSVLTARLSS